MKTSVEISYYPLKEEYKAPIKSFIDRMNTYKTLVVNTSGMSTQIFGEYDEVMGALTAEMKVAFEVPHSVFVMKVINSDLQKIPV